jgi:hypothetical protein
MCLCVRVIVCVCVKKRANACSCVCEYIMCDIVHQAGGPLSLRTVLILPVFNNDMPLLENQASVFLAHTHIKHKHACAHTH